MQHPYGAAERGAVTLRSQLTATLANFVKQAYHTVSGLVKQCSVCKSKKKHEYTYKNSPEFVL
jgi:hypothetical protein